MKFPWRLQRQIIVWTIYTLIVLIPVLFVVAKLMQKSPSCFDNILNQDEERADCGGVCSLQCNGKYRNIKVNFTRALNVSDGKYDIFSLLENFNQNIEFPAVPYNLSFYNFEGKLLGNASGTVSVSAQGQTPIYIPNLDIAQNPKTIELKLGEYKGIKIANPDDNIKLVSVSNWQVKRGANESLQVTGEIANPYNFEVQNLNVYAMLYDDTKTVYAVSSTYVRNIRGREKQAVTFSWGNLRTPANVTFIVTPKN
jgi:hypothetical protein